MATFDFSLIQKLFLLKLKRFLGYKFHLSLMSLRVPESHNRFL
jgi:hypothetical protein